MKRIFRYKFSIFKHVTFSTNLFSLFKLDENIIVDLVIVEKVISGDDISRRRIRTAAFTLDSKPSRQSVLLHLNNAHLESRRLKWYGLRPRYESSPCRSRRRITRLLLTTRPHYSGRRRRGHRLGDLHL